MIIMTVLVFSLQAGFSHYQFSKALILLLLISVTLLTIMIFRLFEYKVLVPLRRLTRQATKIAVGNFDSVIEVESQDEIGQLCTAFNSMSEMIQNNIKEISNTNQALRLSEERWQLALNGSNDGIWDWDIKTGEIFFTSRVKQLFGYPEELHVWSLDEWWQDVHPNDYQVVQQLLQDHLAGKTDSYNVEYRFRCVDNQYKWVFMRGQAVWDESGIPIRIVGSISDITKRKEADEKLCHAYDQLENKVELRTQDLWAMNQELKAVNQELQQTLENLQQTQVQLVQSEKMASLGNLVAGIAHEINTPIGVSVTAVSHMQDILKRFVQLYEKENLRKQDLNAYLAESDEALSIVVSNLERSSKLIQSFKQVSVDQSSEARRVFNVKQYLGEILLSLRPELKKTQHKVSVQCEENLQIDSFPGAFSQIITNLIMNSLIHAYEPDSSGKIVIDITKVDDVRVRLIYSDDGKGIDEQVVDKIFNPFFTTKRGMGGTGLGLYILYNIVTQQFGGTIECISQPGQGTKMIIDFPLGSRCIISE